MTDQRPARNGDSLMTKALSLLPLIITLVTVIAYAVTIKDKVDSQISTSQDHESRIRNLENAMGDIKADTGRLVQELLDKK